MKNFSGKIAFIIGGASGAGLGQAKHFGSLGMKISIADVRQAAIDKALEELKGLGIDAVGYRVDITDKKWYTAVADAAEAHWGGPPHLLIHTAGVNSFGPAEASTFEDYEWIVGVNLYGPIYSCVIWIPRILKAYGAAIKAGETEAHIAFVSSMGAFDGYATDAPYSVSKAGLNNLAYSYYDALKPYGIGVTVVCPANINSNIGEAVKTRPAELANTGYYVSEGTINMLKSIHATGIDPVRLAQALEYCIVNGLPICVPSYSQEEGAPLTSPLGENTFKKFIQWSSVEGMKEIEEEQKRREEMMKNWKPPEGGRGGPGGPGGPFGGPPQSDVPMEVFGQARPDLDWVAEDKRKK